MPRKGLVLPPACLERLRAADLILHAGDWSSMDAVAHGAGDRAAGGGRPRERGGAGRARRAAGDRRGRGRRACGSAWSTTAAPATGRPSRLRRRFPGADAVVFGHSHIPWHEVAGDGFLVLNPGSPTERRRSPRHSMAEIEVDGGRIAAVAFWAVDEPAGPLDPELVGSGPR